MKSHFVFFTIFITISFSRFSNAQMIQLESFQIDEKEVSIGDFSQYIKSTGFKTKAEREGGGLVYEFGWERKPGWNWLTPYGLPAQDDEPAVHITFDEAQAYCIWKGKRLPTEKEWISAAYTEQRLNPSDGFEKGKTYSFPTGNSPRGANCLGQCGDTPAIDYSHLLDRGVGHSRVGSTKRGVNGLYDMGANVWEWVDIKDASEKGTRGGSWWYGSSQMMSDYDATKPRDMAVVYIGFRCLKPN